MLKKWQTLIKLLKYHISMHPGYHDWYLQTSSHMPPWPIVWCWSLFLLQHDTTEDAKTWTLGLSIGVMCLYTCHLVILLGVEMSTGQVARGPPVPKWAGPWLASGRAVIFRPALSKIFATISKYFHQVYNIGYCGLQYCTVANWKVVKLPGNFFSVQSPPADNLYRPAKVEQLLLLWGLGRCCRLRAWSGRSWLRAGPQNGLEIVGQAEHFWPVHISS